MSVRIVREDRTIIHNALTITAAAEMLELDRRWLSRQLQQRQPVRVDENLYVLKSAEA